MTKYKIHNDVYFGRRPQRSENLKFQKEKGEHTVKTTTKKLFIKIENNFESYIVVENMFFYKI